MAVPENQTLDTSSVSQECLHSTEPSCSVHVRSNSFSLFFFFFFLELLYNLTADVDKRHKGQPSRVYFIQSGSQISQLSQQLNLDINREQCHRYTAYVKVSLDWVSPTLLVFMLSCPMASHVLSWSLSFFPMTPSALILCSGDLWQVICLCGLLFLFTYLCNFWLFPQSLFSSS